MGIRVRRQGDEVSAEPYTLWSMHAPFDKHGVPVMGNCGRTIRAVVVMEAETMKRLIAEHPSLAAAQFKLGAPPVEEKTP